MAMRFLQTLVEIGTEQNTTVVLPIPLELVRTFVDQQPWDSR